MRIQRRTVLIVSSRSRTHSDLDKFNGWNARGLLKRRGRGGWETVQTAYESGKYLKLYVWYAKNVMDTRRE